jgi:hypothetical protein
MVGWKYYSEKSDKPFSNEAKTFFNPLIVHIKSIQLDRVSKRDK